MGIVQPRPAVHLTDPRQVLIVGTISSGTSQVANDLKNKLGLEIGHENAVASWSFVRDGTVSWFHGIRYIPRPGIDNNAEHNFVDDRNILKGKLLFQSVVDHLCKELRPTMGFHPFMFRDGKCSLRQKWDDCWKDECKDILTNEWGCGLRKEGDNDNVSNSCETPFYKTLHQARHPLRTVESLVTKFCIGGVKGKVQPSFLAFAGDLFPQHNFLEMSCIEAAGYYTVEYNNAILAARQKGYVNETFKVEQTTPCVIAQIAGFMDDNAIYRFHNSRLLNICNSKDSEATQLMKSKKNLVNKGQLSLDWDDLIGGKHGSRKQNGDRDLYNHVKNLEQALDYQIT